MKVVLFYMPVEGEETSALIGHWACRRDHCETAEKGRGARRSLAARAALRALLWRETGRAGWRPAADALGKPHVVLEGRPGPAVSLGHGGGLAVAALGPEGGRLGVDVEPWRPRNLTALAAAAFGPGERMAVATGGAAAFYRLWSLREAMGKATGQGLALAADGRDHVMGGPDLGWWRQPGWFLGHFRPQADYSLASALALEDADGAAPQTEVLGPEAF